MHVYTNASEFAACEASFVGKAVPSRDSCFGIAIQHYGAVHAMSPNPLRFLTRDERGNEHTP